jgi:hypothetical protein
MTRTATDREVKNSLTINVTVIPRLPSSVPVDVTYGGMQAARVLRAWLTGYATLAVANNYATRGQSTWKLDKGQRLEWSTKEAKYLITSSLCVIFDSQGIWIQAPDCGCNHGKASS